jgi:hypothetical protein
MIDFILELLGDWFVFLPWVRRKRDRRKEWSGTDDGQRKKVRLDRKEDFDIYEEGRRYIKKAGEDLPETKPAV